MKYEALRKLYKVLPTYDALDAEFDVADIEEFSLKEVRKAVLDKVEGVLEILEHIVNPDQNALSDLWEYRMFNEEEKKDVFETFRKIMQLHRALLVAEVARNREQTAQIIHDVHKAWPALRKDCIPFFHKLKSAWEKPLEPKEILEYLG